MFRWDPTQYLQFGDERGRPFGDLIARIDARSPKARARPRLRRRWLHRLAARPLA